MAASHRISRAQGNPAYHAHSFIDFEATEVFGGAVSGQVIGVNVEIAGKVAVAVFADASYSHETAGAATVSESIYEARKALAALIQTGIGLNGYAWATETSKTTCRINVLAKSQTTGHFANMSTPTLVAPV